MLVIAAREHLGYHYSDVEHCGSHYNDVEHHGSDYRDVEHFTTITVVWNIMAVLAVI